MTVTVTVAAARAAGELDSGSELDAIGSRVKSADCWLAGLEDALLQ